MALRQMDWFTLNASNDERKHKKNRSKLRFFYL